MKRIRTSRLLSMAALAAATLLAVRHADAQRPAGTARGRAVAPRGSESESGRGLMFGVHLLAAPGVSITGEDIFDRISTGFGPGAGVTVAYGFNRTLSAFASLDVAKQGSGMPEVEGNFGLSHFEVGVRANLAVNPLFTPYVTAGVGRRAVGARITDLEFDEEYDLSFSGTMVAVGGGIQRVLSPTLSLDGGLSIGFGAFDTAVEDGQRESIDVNGSTSMRLRFGVLWRP